MSKSVKYIMYCLILALLTSCNSEPKEEAYAFFEDGKVHKSWLRLDDGRVVGEKHYYETGKLRMAGKFNDNEKRHGLWSSFFEDGTVWSTCEYENGEKHGENKSYYPDGKLRFEGSWSNGVRIGSWITYDEEGKVINQESL